MAESVPDVIGPITLGAKRAGKPGAGEPHAGFDVAGAGDVAMGAGLRPEAKAEDEPPDPTVGGWGPAMVPGYPSGRTSPMALSFAESLDRRASKPRRSPIRGRNRAP